MALFQTEKPDLVILDIMLPGHDGYEICKKIRQTDQTTPIIMLTARDRESDKLLGFELGADDYVTKPFSIKELMARINVILRRVSLQIGGPEIIQIGDAEINFLNFELKRDDQVSALSPKECEILKYLTQHMDEVIPRDRLIEAVWGDDYVPSPRTIDNFILKLRNKIEANPRQPRHLLTVHGAGYKLKQ
jgi:DNA-binding response OmpR family regulator